MKRIVSIGAVVAAFAIAPTVASAGNFAAQVKPQISAQVVRTQVARTQVANAQRARAAVSAERHQMQIELAHRVALVRALVR